MPSIEPLKGACDEAGLPLGDDDLVEQLLLLLFAGYETTAASLGCLLLMLLQHPEAIEWLQEDIDTLPWPLAPDQLEQLERAERLDAVVKELMRLIPPVGGLFRRTTAPVRLLGYEIPAGRVIQVNISGQHRDPRVYAVPEEFQADRHLRQPLNAPGYIPFGGGPRVCRGRPLAELEVRLLAVRLLQTRRFTLVPQQNLNLETIPTAEGRIAGHGSAAQGLSAACGGAATGTGCHSPLQAVVRVRRVQVSGGAARPSRRSPLGNREAGPRRSAWGDEDPRSGTGRRRRNQHRPREAREWRWLEPPHR